MLPSFLGQSWFQMVWGKLIDWSEVKDTTFLGHKKRGTSRLLSVQKLPSLMMQDALVKSPNCRSQRSSNWSPLFPVVYGLLKAEGLQQTSLPQHFWDMLLSSNSRCADIFYEKVKCLTFNIWYIFRCIVNNILFYETMNNCILFYPQSTQCPNFCGKEL